MGWNESIYRMVSFNTSSLCVVQAEMLIVLSRLFVGGRSKRRLAERIIIVLIVLRIYGKVIH